MTLDAHIDERTLRELYLAPFEAIVREAGVWSVMASYNAVNGEPMTESSLLRDVLQRELDFDGLVMSDWFATSSTDASARAALDLVMPGPDGPWGEALVQAVRAGKVDPATIDDKVLRVLRLAARVGALEGTAPSRPPAFDDHDIAAALRRIAAAGFVLARNERALLPLDRGGLERVAVIGPNAAAARTLGGGSATVLPPYTVSPLEGLRSALHPAVQSLTAWACSRATGSRWRRCPVCTYPRQASPASSSGFSMATGRCSRANTAAGVHSSGSARSMSPERSPGSRSTPCSAPAVRARTPSGRPGLAATAWPSTARRCSTSGSSYLRARTSSRALMTPPQTAHRIELDAGREIGIVLTHDVQAAPSGDGLLAVSFQLNVAPPYAGDDHEIERAEAIAAEADIVVLVVGTTEEVESEGFDRTSLSLPGRQDELVRRVAAANRNTIVVVNAGAPVLMPWADDVAAVLLAWFPGQEFGNALADVLLGVAEPGGRLPTTWPASEAGLPSTRPIDGVLRYDEGLSVGYRDGGRDTLFPFGHGLGYSSWEYEALDSPPRATPGAAVRVTVELRNTGGRRSREVVQLYASRSDSGIERPVRWLVGFAAVIADPGERVTATLIVPPRAFEHWSVEHSRWAARARHVRSGRRLILGGAPMSTRITVA